jgi:L-fuconolactonase
MNRIDAHQHFWTLARGDYSWQGPHLGPIHRDFGPADLRPLAIATGVVGTVLVQAAPSEAETHFMLDLARASDGLVRGVVGWVDFEARDAPDRLAQLARDPLLKGVRPMLQNIPDSAWILRPVFTPVLRAIITLGLTFDALVKPPQLPHLPALIERHPDLPIIVDHGAKPPIASGEFDSWAQDIARVAAFPHVRCKLSGLVTEDGPAWSVARLERYVTHLLDCFGPERLVWGSDWPVLGLRASYGDWVKACDTLLAGLDAAARRRIFAENAIAFYKL